jgi:hypothetical protein
MIDQDERGVELQRIELAYPVGEVSVVELLRARVVADVQRLDRDHPEQHVALVQALRSRVRDGEIELFTAPMVDVDVQVRAASDALASGDLTLNVDSKNIENGESRVSLSDASVMRFCRLGILLGG